MTATPALWRTRSFALSAIGVSLALTIAACGTGATTASEEYPTSLVLADRETGDDFHPASGYGQTGVSMLYDGLLRPTPTVVDGHGDRAMPTFEPALATEIPTPNGDSSEWTVHLKEGVTFHDGSALDAKDVVATYDTLRNEDWGSSLVNRYNLISSVHAVDEHTVRFDLAYPYPLFATRLTASIAPSELVGEGTADRNPLSSEPVGTGPYKLTELGADRVEYEANEDYWNGAPEVKHLTVVTTSDDSARGQRVASGELDGAALPAAIAAPLQNRDDLDFRSVRTADWKGISLPNLPVLADAKVRRALNFGVDRQAIVDASLRGLGVPISTHLWDIYGDLHNPSATFTFDREKAKALLDDAGWREGPDGIRVKDGQRFSVPLLYASSDSMRRDLAVEFSAQMKQIGLEFPVEDGSWDEIRPQLGAKAAVLGGGSSPYAPDLMAYDDLHRRTEISSAYNNPGNHGSEHLDHLLDVARKATTEEARARAYHDVQKAYVADPSYVVLAAPNHNYVSKRNQWSKGALVVEPHIHSTTWGPWWNLGTWRK